MPIIDTKGREEARDALRRVHTEKLDALRAQLPTMRTSELIMLLTHAPTLNDLIVEEDVTQADRIIATGVAVVILGDEIDRRIPIPK